MRSFERTLRAESTLRELIERLENGRLWASDLDRIAACASVLDDFTPKDPAWPLRERFLSSSREVLALLREARTFDSVAEAVRIFRGHVPIYVSRDRAARIIALVMAVVVTATMLVSRAPLCALFGLLPLLFCARAAPVAVSRAMVVYLGRAIEPREIAGITLSFDARFTYLVLRNGARVLIGPGEIVQALREIGVERI